MLFEVDSEQLLVIVMQNAATVENM